MPSRIFQGHKEGKLFVSITFDDGTKSQYKTYFPILEEYGLRSTFYVITSLIDKFDCITWEQLKDLYYHDCEIGSHAHTHQSLLKASKDEIENELRISKRLLNQFGCSTLAFPRGEYNNATIEIAKRYYVAARGYYDHSTCSRDFGFNYPANIQPYKLRVFPMDHTWPDTKKIPIHQSLNFFSRTIKRIVNQGIARNAWAIFVFHDIGIGSLRNILARNILSNNRKKLINASLKSARFSSLITLARSIITKGQLDNFIWFCQFLSKNDHVEIVTINELFKNFHKYKKRWPDK